MSTYEEGVAALERLIEWVAANPSERGRNEASTRFHLIDQVVSAVLGWAPEDVRVERHLDRTFTDYELGRLGSSVVIEAKREDTPFQLPEGFASETIGLRALKTLDPAVAEAIEQVMRYAQARGIPLAVATNGHQYLTFLASRIDGQPPESGRAIAFSSLEDVRNRFRDFWSYLSPEGVNSHRASRFLQTTLSSLKPEKLSARIIDYPGYKNRNPTAAQFQILGGLFIEDITRQEEVEEDFLKYCYLSSGSLPQYALVSREILATRYSIFFEKQGEISAEPVRTKEGMNPALFQDAIAASLSDRPILLVGDVGAGKSIFISHLIKVAAVEELKNAVVLYIDFGRQPAVADDLNRFVRKEFIRQLQDNYGIDVFDRSFIAGVHHGKVLQFERGPAGLLKGTDDAEYTRRRVEFLESLVADEGEHLQASILHLLKARRQQTVVFLDNIDQRPSTFQEEVFLIGQSIAATWDATVFVSLRPETFYSSKVSGSLSGYQPRVFTVSPPRVDRVVLKRLEFAQKQLERTGRLPSMPEGITFQSDDLQTYLRVLLRAFAHNERIIEFVENMSAGNVRAALDFVVAFIGSAHVDSQKILEIERTSASGYTLPIHEFLRAVIFGDNEHYNPQISRIPNLFDVASQDGREHFLLPLLLSFTRQRGSSGAEYGFVAVQELYEWAGQLAFVPGQVEFAIQRGIRKRMFDSHPRLDQSAVDGEEVPEVSRVRITAAGVYAAQKLLGMFAYLDAMVVDTPVVEEEYRSRIGDARTIEDRLNRAELFIEYLDRQWYLLSGDDLCFDWLSCRNTLESEIRSVRTRILQQEFPLRYQRGNSPKR